MTNIHPTAVVSSKAEIGQDVVIGPLSIVEDHVVIGDGCVLCGHTVVKCGTTLGQNNTIGEGTVLGARPQHANAPQRVGLLIIGNNNVIRENVTAHRALDEGEATYIGHHNLLMVNVHIGHDCQIADHVIIANNTMLAGHTTIGHHAYLSGGVAMHQFCRIGEYAMVGGQAHVKQDVPPFVTVDGYSTQIVGLNVIGLRRNGFSNAEIKELKAAYRVIYRSDISWEDRLKVLSTEYSAGHAAAFRAFLTSGQRGFVQARQEPRTSNSNLSVQHSSADSDQVRRAA